MQKLIKHNDEFLTLTHYKEPLEEVTEGYGYYGALLVTSDGDKIQCHICGNLFTVLYAHIQQRHKMSVRSYKEKFKLAKQTALISETWRAAMKERTISWLNSLSPQEKKAYLDRQRERLKRVRPLRPPYQPKLSLETKNKRGTCPDQILDKIKQARDHFQRTPSLKEFVQFCNGQRYKHLVYSVFGSWKNALTQLGLQPPPLVSKGNPFKKRLTEEGMIRGYTEDELLGYLVNFAKTYKKVPTYTDFKRHLLPSHDTYIRHFGTIEEARKRAGVYEYAQFHSRKGKAYFAYR